MFAPAQHLDPLRTVHGTGNDRYDCPDLATLDHHIHFLRRRIGRLGHLPAADVCRADIDRLLDRRSWLTLPVTAHEPAARAQANAECPVIARPTMSDWTVSVPS
jgi:hypothetical protein